MSREDKTSDVPHIALAVFATGAMALGLAVGFEFIGLAGRMNGFFAKIFQPMGMPLSARSLDPVALWLGTAVLAFALPSVMLNVPGAWRRIVIWLGAFLLTVSWGPVLILASYLPEIGVGVVAVVWSGFCSMVYASNHLLPVDKTILGINGPC